MYFTETKVRVRYAETDQMGFVYYGAYAQYLEVGRVELLRSLGISYKKIEELGFALPVSSMKINYLSPALYDDILTIKTTVENKPGVKIIFNYEIYKSKNLINTSQVILVFVKKETKKPCLPPRIVLEKFDNI